MTTIISNNKVTSSLRNSCWTLTISTIITLFIGQRSVRFYGTIYYAQIATDGPPEISSPQPEALGIPL